MLPNLNKILKNLLSIDHRKTNESCKLSVLSVFDKNITMAASIIKAPWKALVIIGDVNDGDKNLPGKTAIFVEIDLVFLYLSAFS